MQLEASMRCPNGDIRGNERLEVKHSLPTKLDDVVVFVSKPHEQAHGARQSERGQHKNHEDEKVVRLLHDS